MIQKHFRVYNSLLDKIRVKQMELIKLKEDWYTISGVDYDKVKVMGGTQIDMADQLHDIVEKEKELVALVNYKNELRRVHENEINKLSRTNQRTVLKLFYLDGCSIKQIAYCLKVSSGHVQKLKRWGVTEFVEKVIK